MSSTIAGYLVVLREPDYVNPLNARYRGVDRNLPYPPPYAEEEAAVECETFELSDDNGFLPDLQTATRFLKMLSKSP